MQFFVETNNIVSFLMYQYTRNLRWFPLAHTVPPSPIGSARKINFATIYQLGWSFLRWANSLRPAAGPVEIGVSGTNKGHNEPPFIWFTPSPGARQRLSKSTNWQQIFQLFCFAPYLWKSPNIPLSRRGRRWWPPLRPVDVCLQIAGHNLFVSIVLISALAVPANRWMINCFRR